MRIGIDVRKVFDSGIGTYIRNLLHEYPALEPGNKYVLFAAPGDIERLNKEVLGDAACFTVVSCTAGKYSLRELWSLTTAANKLRLDVFHAPHFTCPVGLRMPLVVTIHDLTPLRFPRQFSLPRRVYARMMMAHACRSAAVVITDSKYTQGDVRNEFNVPSERLVTVPLGPNPAFAPASARKRTLFREAYNLAGRYVLYAGNFKPHKNIEALLQAMVTVPPHDIERVVLVGDSAETLARVTTDEVRVALGPRLRVLGKVPFPHLVAAYSEALATVLPSRYEGFGYPVLEAMACGSPLVVADATSLPEVAGSAALYFAPDDSAALAAHLCSLATDEAQRLQLIQRGFQRVADFSNQRTSADTLAIYRRLAG